MNIFVGNLEYSVEDSDLQKLFSQYGKVISAKVIKDMYSGRSKGFGFVEIEAKDDAEKAITATNGADLNGRALTVNEARPSTNRGGGGGGGGRDRDGGGFGQRRNEGGGGRRY